MDYEESELRENFDYFDEDDNGMIDRAEFGRLLSALGAEMSDEDLDVGFDIIDTNDNGTIEYNEFASWWGNR